MGEYGLTDYYQECLQKSLEYQDFLFEWFRGMDGMPILLGAYASKKYQYGKGESLSGIEIKYDMKLSITGNLFVEYEEKTDPSNKIFVPSGIMRNDNTWLYLIGDYEQAFIFAKTTLRAYCTTHKEKLAKRPSSTKTSWGYLLPIEQVFKNEYLLAKHISFRK